MADKQKLFNEFPPVSTSAWEQKIEQDLKGADYEKKLIWKTLEGIKVRPYYRAEDLADQEYLDGLPGKPPYVRGNATGANDWLIRQDIILDDIAEANKKSLFVLDRGITSLGFITTPPAGKQLLHDQNDFSQLLKDIYFECIHLNFVCGGDAPQIVKMLDAERRTKSIDQENIFGAVDFDPLGYLTTSGNWSADEHTDMQQAAGLVKFTAENLPQYRVLGINGYFLSNAGASIVQELGYSLAMAAEYFRKLTDSGLSPDLISRHIQLNLGVGTNYFMEIAKIRAMRYLWAKLAGAFQPESDAALKADIHSITSEWSQTIYDPYVNVLRATTESMAAVIGGTDSLTVRPFTYAYKPTTKFSGRIARNIQIILKEEAYLGKIKDPGAGSYYIENLTNSLIEEAWQILLKTEDAGGYLSALKKGIVQEDIKTTADKRRELIATRREVLLGTNQYPNAAEEAGREIDRLRAFPEEKQEATIVAPIKKYRGAMAFEKLRLATEKHPGGKPVVALLTFGNPVMRRARAGFSANFFACAGYEVIDHPGFDTPADGVKSAVEAGARMVVLCSDDEEYATLAPKVKAMLPENIILVVAGAPPSMEELKGQGIENFIHMRSNVLETLTEYHRKLGIVL